MFADIDSDLAPKSYDCSLVCPLGKIKVNTPAKSINCKRLQCFDALFILIYTFILMHKKIQNEYVQFVIKNIYMMICK